MMTTKSDFEQRLVTQISDSTILERYWVKDPLVLQQVRAIASYLEAISQDIEVASLEPFIRTRDRSILADASNKGILPTAVACQFKVDVKNKASNTVTLSQGRHIEDNGGRVWRLLQSVTVAPQQTVTITAEQSEYREVEYVAEMTEPFHKKSIDLLDDLYLANLTVTDHAIPLRNSYLIQPQWLNVEKGAYAINVTTDSLRRIFVEFGDSERAGITVNAGDTFTFGITETYGEIDVSKLKDASLTEVNTTDEQRISVSFQSGGLVRSGTTALTIDQLRVLASYPSIYGDNAVFLGNFDYLVRKKVMGRTDFVSVWNENVQDTYYGVTYKDINHLHVAFKAKVDSDQSIIENEIKTIIGRADSLFQDRVIVHEVVEKPLQLTITGRLASVHDLDSVVSQIKGLLVDRYGRSSLSASRWLLNGFNSQEVANLLRNNITAFQDRVSDFAVHIPTQLNLPHEWVYLSEESISVQLDRTADSVGTAWIL
ncbi:hypothetical protein [Acinetobacter rathckeae]|uniref:hypothetical protein n=1 Tax=Acinetobacter rathckeae TaxID=2605272 RepID=UPI0018A291C0|nr:hypothetical protein [Acinetobacter rathckeae]MBF7696208.1 hypothetical protein [Acinetobacter rathckeae]